MSEEPNQNQLPRTIRIGLLVIAAFAILGAVLHSFEPSIDQTTAIFLGIAIITLLGPQITKFKGFGFEIEREVQKLRADIKDVEKAFVGLEKDVGPGSKTAVAPMPNDADLRLRNSDLPFDPEDPNKGRFGGSPESNGRRLTASIKPVAGPKSSRCDVTIRVASTDPQKPLTGRVKFHLHPTFRQWSSYDVDVKGGIAEDRISSYGAFTIGVEADEGKTRLELDLVDVPGGTRAFYDL